jgi:GT2 family glycosyltransferase
MNRLKKLILKKLDLDYTYFRMRSEVSKLAERYELQQGDFPEIDIIMPTFNRSRETRRIIKNLYDSTSVKFNLIIVDNYSKDDTREYLENLASKKSNIRLVFLGENLGGAGARNEGIKYAKNEFIAFLDNDIFIMPYYFENLIQSLRDDKDVAAIQSKVIMPNGLIQINRPYYEIENKWIIFNDKDYEKRFDDSATFQNTICNWIPSGATLWRKEIFDKHKFDLSLGTYYEDNEFSYRLSKKGYYFKNNYKALCMHYSSNFAPETSRISSYEKERFSKDAIKSALYNFYKKHEHYLAYGDIKGHVNYVGFNTVTEYINFLESDRT